jgi:hypothetical protein
VNTFLFAFSTTPENASEINAVAVVLFFVRSLFRQQHEIATMALRLTILAGLAFRNNLTL